MLRKVGMVVAVGCVATVVSLCFAMAVLWFRGQLTGDAISAMAAILRGEEPDAMTETEEAGRIDPSGDDIVDERVTRLLDIESREKEVDLLLGMVNERADAVEAGQRALDARTKAFEERLRTLEEQWQSEATTQVRAVLKAQAPEDAVVHLGQLELDAAVVLVRGLPEKSIARILQQFAQSNDEKEIKRGREIFEALTRAEPHRTLLSPTASTEDDAGAPATR